MENLEEVLQALDEFQKMRPTVIPQELEDYLCWVAKTGDPVYQWPLIKTLFREKLTRVMTDFYESCPSLELATCPNVEHFNYDTMKSSLLEKLESFANAPFTVQRICELLTSPRKEYNRVDKFMRAIEKNILVVSTREPGPIARRGETGDGMVNGSVEEDTALVMQQQPPPPPLSLSPTSSPSPSPSSSPSQSSSPSPSPSPSPSSSPSLSQPPLQSPPHSPSQLPQTTQSAETGQPNSQDVEMDWENDCTSSVTISVHTVAENESPLLHSGVIPTVSSQLAKSTFTVSETTREKLEQATSRTEIATSNYVSATSDFSTISNLTSQAQSQEPVSTISAVPVVQNLPATETVSDDSLVGSSDVTEAIINEDTTSQPNLDLENEEIEPAATATTTTTTMTSTATTTATSTATTTVTVVATVIPLTTDTTQKLQAAFQAKHFESDDKCLKKANEKTPVSSTMEEGIEHSIKNEETTLTKLSPECMDSEMSHDESRLTENLLKIDTEMRSDALANNAESISEERILNKPEKEGTSILEDMDEEHLRSRIEENIKTAVFIESQSAEKESAVPSDECVSAVIVSSGEALYKTEKTETHSTETSTTISLKENFTHDQPISQKAEIIEVTDKVLEAIPNIASSNGNDDGEEAHDTGLNEDNLKLMDIISEKANIAESAVSDSISVIEKPKEVTSVIEKLDLVKPTVETTEDSDISYESPKDDNLTGIENDSLANVQGNKTACVIKENQSSVIESVPRRREHESMELMEVDDEESLSTFQQGEPMEQETTVDDLSKS